MLGSILANIKGRLSFEIGKLLRKEPYVLKSEVDSYVEGIEKNGYAVVENFYTTDECEALRNEVDRLIEKRSLENNLWHDECKADNRVYCAEDESALVARFHNDPFLLSVAENYFGGKMVNSNTLAARIDFKEHNKGSGGGWHRDGNHFQFKAIVYLSDVEIDNGPFQIIRGSHKFYEVLKDTLTMEAEPLNTRFTHEQVKRVIEKKPDTYKVLTAKAGTLVFADVSTIHTGMPIRSGSRYTLFNYFYPSYDGVEGRRNFFKNIAKTQEYA